MSIKENKATARRIVHEVLNRKFVSVTDSIVAAEAFDHDVLPGLPAGAAGWTQYFTNLHAAFPDLKASLDIELADGDKVVHHLTMDGTHQGAFMGVEPTGKHARWTETHIYRFHNGRIAEHWGSVDILGILQQVGRVTGLPVVQHQPTIARA